MAKLLTGNSSNQHIVFSNSVWDKLEYAATMQFGNAGNTNIELLVSGYLSAGLRRTWDAMDHGHRTASGISAANLDVLKTNEE